MRKTIKDILKEDNNERYHKVIIDGFIKDISVERINVEFNSSLELRDMGYDDGMIEFAYSNYGDYGFTYFEEEDGFKKAFEKEGEEGFWDSDDMVQEMMYNYIDKGVKDGIFIETTDGWEVITNEFEIITKYGNFLCEYLCTRDRYSRLYYGSEIIRVLENTFGLIDEEEQKKVLKKINNKFIEILDTHKKVCH